LKKKILTILRFSFFLGIGIFFIWLFLRNLTVIEKREILKAFRIANYWWIILAIILGLLSHWLRAMRWRILMEPLGYNPRRINVYMAVFIGYLANMALPRLGEVSRCGVLTQYEKIPFNKSFGTVITERAIDMLAFIVLFLLMIFTMSKELSVYVDEKIYTPFQEKFNVTLGLDSNFFWLVVITAVIFIGLFLFFRKRIVATKAYLKVNQMLMGFLSGIKSLMLITKPIRFIIYTILIWVLYLLMAYVVFFSLKETSLLTLEAGLAVLVFGSIGIMIVQGGIGIYPAIVAETLFLFGITSTTGYAMGWLIWSSQTIMVLIAGLFSLLLLNMLNSKGNVKFQPDSTEDTQPAGSSTGTGDLE
jgi:glycosyltransferase 2 family protein